MRHFFGATLLCLLVTTQAIAADTPPSDQSIQRLLEVTESRKLMDNALAAVDASMDAGIKAALNGQKLDEKTQQVVDDMRRKLTDVIRESMAWTEIQPLLVQVYQQSLTQGEVDGMLKFYESEAGKALIRKMPLIQQNSMQIMQGRLQAMMPRIAQIQKEAMEQLKASGPPKPAP